MLDNHVINMLSGHLKSNFIIDAKLFSYLNCWFDSTEISAALAVLMRFCVFLMVVFITMCAMAALINGLINNICNAEIRFYKQRCSKWHCLPVVFDQMRCLNALRCQFCILSS